MAKRKHKSLDSAKESVEEQVLKKYHKSKEIKAQVLEQTGEEIEVKAEDQTDPSDPTITESDVTEAEKILKKVKKIKDKNKKKSKKLEKAAKTLSKEQNQSSDQKSEENSDNKTDAKSLSAINYLKNWKERPNEWKFNKISQNWLLKNWRNINKIGAEEFDIFVQYVAGLHPESSAKKRLESEAKQLVDDQTEAEEVIERARSVSQCFV